MTKLNDTPTELYLSLIGPFFARFSDGQRVELLGKNLALLALLASSPNGERSRNWLQSKLWSDRAAPQAAGSLRQALFKLRCAFAPHNDFLFIDREKIRLDLSRVRVDVDDLHELLARRPKFALFEFLEGLDIVDEEFNDWLREQRGFWQIQLADVAQSVATQSETILPARAISSDHKLIPSLAVQPFNVAANTRVDIHIEQGVIERIVDQMSRIRWIATMSRNTSFAPELKDLNPIQFGERVKADFLVTGLWRSNPEAQSIDVELLGMPGANVLRQLSFPVLTTLTLKQIDDISIEIAGNLSDCIGQTREKKAQSKATQDDQDSDLIWRGRWHMHRLTKDDFSEARACFEQVINNDPTNAEAHLNLATCNLWDVWTRRGSEDEIRKVRGQAQRAISLDLSDGRGYWITGMAEVWLRNSESGERYIRESLRLCPSSAFAHVQLATQRIYCGRPKEAYEPLELALRLSPFDRQRFNLFGEYSMAALLAEDFELACEMARRTLLLRPGYWYAHMTHALALSRSGNVSAALLPARSLFRARPDFSDKYIKWLPFVDLQVPKNLIADIGKLSRQIDGVEFPTYQK